MYLKKDYSIKMNRAIVHMDLDTFFVSCERLINPKLMGLPLIIGGSSDRGVVASCSYRKTKIRCILSTLGSNKNAVKMG